MSNTVVFVVAVAALLLIVGLAVANRVAAKHGVRSVFLAAYTYKIDQGQSAAEALLAAINVFRERSPFNVVSESQARWLSELFSNLQDPTVLADVFQQCEKQQDAQVLQNRERMQALHASIAARQSARASAG